MKRSRINPVSEKREAELDAYRAMLDSYTPTHCARCHQPGTGWLSKGGNLDPHHPYGRGRGKHQWKTLAVLPLCRSCHNQVHEYPKRSRKEGWIIDQKPAINIDL